MYTDGWPRAANCWLLITEIPIASQAVMKSFLNPVAYLHPIKINKTKKN